MSGCSGNSSSHSTGTCLSEDIRSEIEDLVKAGSIEEASQLIRNGHVLMAVYWNSQKSCEEYILGRIKKKKVAAKKVGFLKT